MAHRKTSVDHSGKAARNLSPAARLAAVLMTAVLAASPGVEAGQCEPKFYYIGGLGGSYIKSDFRRELFSPAISGERLREQGIDMRFFSHLQGADDHEHCPGLAIGGWLATTSCMVGTGLFAPPFVPACILLISAGAAACTFITGQGELEQSLMQDLENDDNPVVLVGHSWGGDTAQAFTEMAWARSARKMQAGSENQLILVTLDAVSRDHTISKRRVPGTSWVNVYTDLRPGKKGSCLLGDGLAAVGGKWGFRDNAEVNINANMPEYRRDLKAGKNVSHCDVGVLYYLAQEHIEREVRKSCGNDFLLPKCRIVEGRCVYD